MGNIMEVWVIESECGGVKRTLRKKNSVYERQFTSKTSKSAQNWLNKNKGNLNSNCTFKIRKKSGKDSAWLGGSLQ